ncbi:MAG: CpXC domain-containing protein [Bacteroidales bacterium]|nr:CpXC domain-containing protein [Bacteroidales bacterium]
MKRFEKVVCGKCGKIHEIEAYPSINAVEDPELKIKAMSGEIFAWECPECGTTNLASYPLLYHDPSENLLLILSAAPLNAESCPENYIGRQVGTVGEFIEKIKIFDAGLDDITIEMCKFITVQELGRKVDLKFYKLDGADSEITFTYPENGRMELLVVGFNVYEDCAGILRRNPKLKEAASGLARIDRFWLERHLL